MCGNKNAYPSRWDLNFKLYTSLITELMFDAILCSNLPDRVIGTHTCAHSAA